MAAKAERKLRVVADNRKARFYSLTSKGRAELNARTDQWRRLTTAMDRILSPEPEEA